ncbi:PLP-dependent aminotransferase family protein [Metabacillus fastidiosus]|uniref:MocR-like pyridoxine biosynthesis transcription factor PdxR n=1 Tax=Metabacillus fastidiosus TaxID=1458 RepID=UPI002DBDBA88|nr:PLP-dependent aminotransferase family protein [Metabacillus fastidiosus]MEC2074649.1 PLP-dependent aminotransferase family protein [Metabacillus fastidiosus]
MIVITPKLDMESKEALYIQLYKYIRNEIMEGRMEKNSKLPSIRILCDHLNISRTPVVLAYEQLLAEGYIQSKPRSGFFIMDIAESSFFSSNTLIEEKDNILSSPSRLYHASKYEEVLYDFGYGSVDLEYFPFIKWKKMMNRCLLPESSELLLYGDLQGDEELREEIAVYLHQIRGVRCSPQQIVIGAGTYHSLDLLFQLLKEDISLMALEKSVNDGVQTLIEQYHFGIHSLELEHDGVRMEDVYKSKAQAVYVTPSHQFPFGMTMSVNKRIKLLNWANKEQAYIIENDYDGEFRYNSRPIPSLQSFDQNERVIYIGTFSKALTPSFRISYLVLPTRLLERFREKKHSYDQLASPIFQKTLQMFMKSSDFERHMRKMRNLYKKKHDILLQAIHEYLGDNVTIIGAGSGLHILLEVRNGMTEDELIESAKQRGVKIYPTSVYALKGEQSMIPTVLLGFGGLSEERIVLGIEQLKIAWSIE